MHKKREFAATSISFSPQRAVHTRIKSRLEDGSFNATQTMENLEIHVAFYTEVENGSIVSNVIIIYNC